jgi:hypothetical protein
MTAEDFARLRLYRAKRGPLNPILRADAGFALLAACTFNAQGAKKKDGSQFAPSDFMPWAKDDESDEPASIESVFGMFKALARPKREA